MSDSNGNAEYNDGKNMEVNSLQNDAKNFVLQYQKNMLKLT